MASASRALRTPSRTPARVRPASASVPKKDSPGPIYLLIALLILGLLAMVAFVLVVFTPTASG